MNAQEIIDRLKEIIAKHGDLAVTVAGFPVESVKLKNPEEKKSSIELAAFAD